MPDPVGQGSLPFLYNDFHGGLNTKDAAYLLEDSQARDLLNVQGTTAGAIVKRTGLVTFGSVSPPLQSLYGLESTTSPFLIAASSTNLYSVSTGGIATSIGTGFTNGRWEFISAPSVGGQGPLYGMNGVDTPQQWTGTGSVASWTATDAGGTVPNGKYVIYANNQAFVAGVSTAPSTVFWSGIADPTAWNPLNINGSGFMQFDPNDGEAITGLGRVGPYVLVCKPRKLWILVDPASATARRLSDNVGCPAHRSIASGPEGTYFLAEDRGVYLTNGSKLTPVSDHIQPTLDAINPALRGQAAGACVGGHYYLSIPTTQTYNDTTLDFDETLASWWKHSIPSMQFTVWHPSGGAQLFSAKGSATAGTVDQCFVPGVYTDNGSAMTWVWRGPWQSPTFYRRRRFPTPYFRKRLRQVRVDGAGTVDVSMAKDFATMETLVRSNVFSLTGSSTFGGSGIYGDTDGSMFGGGQTIGRAKLFTLGVANAFSLVFSSTSSTQDVLLSYVLMMTDRRDLVAS